MTRDISLITTSLGLDTLAERCHDVPRIALDLEADGLHAFRAKLCVAQVAFVEDAQLKVAIIDTLQVPIERFDAILGPDGPIKILHDASFDTRILNEAGVELANIHDTSVMAQYLGERATGLATLLDKYCGQKVSKKLQEHNWGARPITPAQIDYLAGDVLYLFELADKLSALAVAAGIQREVAVACSYKLTSALKPPRDQRPGWARIKGFEQLENVNKAILKRLVITRDEIAAERDRPAFKVAPNSLLLTLAQSRIDRPEKIQALCRQRGAARFARRWADAVVQGADEPTPKPVVKDGKQRPPVGHKKVEARLNRWRKKEAQERGVDLQVVLPGHCVGGLVKLLLTPPDVEHWRGKLAQIDGLGEVRIDRYSSRWRRLSNVEEPRPSQPNR